MSLSIERTSANERFQQARTLLSFIKTQESSDVPPIDTDEVKILRGLFFVHLYGSFEKSVNEAVEKYIQKIDELNVAFCDFSSLFLPTALDPVFTSIQMGGKWDKRVDFFKAIESTEKCSIRNTIFSDQLINTWFKNLDRIAICIGARRPFLKNYSDSLYLDEVVEKRNQVAHGRNTPLSVGSSGRSADLESRFVAVRRVFDDYCEMLESHYNCLEFIKASSRADYTA
jgi:hypothetical protein